MSGSSYPMEGNRVALYNNENVMLVWAAGDHQAIIVLIHHCREYYASLLSDCAPASACNMRFINGEPGR